MIDTDRGRTLVSHARSTIERAVRSDGVGNPTTHLDSASTGTHGTFVTLTRREQLRGCKGYPEPVAPLRRLVETAAVDAAVRDPRFSPLEPAELDVTKVSTTVLSSPTALETAASDRPAAIEVGTHGVVAIKADRRGLLLPQVAVDRDWDAETFLSATCRKAGLRPDAWRDPATEIRRFEGTVFAEVAPGGPIEREPEATPDP